MQRGDGKFGPNLKSAGPPRSLPGAGREPGLAAPRQRHFRADFSACSWQDGSRGALKLGTQILLRNRIWAKAAWRRGWHPILRNTVQLQTTIWPLNLTSSLAKWMAILTGVVCAHRRRARGPSTGPGTCLETRPCLLPPSACTWALLNRHLALSCVSTSHFPVRAFAFYSSPSLDRTLSALQSDDAII